MTKRTRRNHSPAFKVKVALAAIKGERTIADLAHCVKSGRGRPAARWGSRTEVLSISSRTFLLQFINIFIVRRMQWGVHPMPDALQIATFTITFLVPSIIGASSSDFLKAVATAAVATFIGLMLFEVLFGGWSPISYVGIESQLFTSASAVPTSVALGAAGFGLRRLWLYVRQPAGRRSRPLSSG